MGFQEAVKKGSKLRAALLGPAGSGKTYTALELAKTLGCVKVAVIDSERGSAKKYADKFKFLVSEPETFDPRKYTDEILEAAKQGCDCLILDSFSAVWSGKGGFLEKVDTMGGSSFSNGWKAMSPVYNTLIDTILKYPGHVIATMRSKTEYVVEVNDKGKAAPKKVGTKPVQREDAEYEFDLVLQMGHNGEIFVMKQRGCPKLEGLTTNRSELPMVYQEIKTWLEI